MTSVKLGIIDIFPVSTRSPTQTEIVMAGYNKEPIPTSQNYSCLGEILPEIIKNNGAGAANDAMDAALRSSKVYKEWRKYMPTLKNVPNVHRYRKNEKVDVSSLEKEIKETKFFLPTDQILYHGGVLVAEKDQIKIDRPLSTSLLPSVALWHAKQHQKGEIAILRITQKDAISAFVFGITGNQDHKQEREVLLCGKIVLSKTRERSIYDMKVAEYDVMQPE